MPVKTHAELTALAEKIVLDDKLDTIVEVLCRMHAALLQQQSYRYAEIIERLLQPLSDELLSRRPDLRSNEPRDV